MDTCAFDSLLRQMTQLSTRQCGHVLAALKTSVDQVRAATVLEAAAADNRSCPHCHGTSLYRHGAANGLRRFGCRKRYGAFFMRARSPLQCTRPVLRHRSACA